MSSSEAAYRRGGTAGLVFIGLLVAQALIAGQPKKPNDQAETIAGWQATTEATSSSRQT